MSSTRPPRSTAAHRIATALNQTNHVWIVDVDGPQRAYQIAATASAAPGPGGAPLNLPIEVREVMMTVVPRDL